MKTRRIIFTALLSLLCVSALSAQVHRGPTWVSPCTLDVVLVTFDDATTPAGGYDYHEHDLPYGYTRQGVPTSSSYTLREFERLFSGGYGSLQDSAFVGNKVKVAKGNHTLPEVFGSVRAYFDSISTSPNARPDSGPPGVFQLHVRMINPADSQGYPRWIVLPETKAHYAEINANDEERSDLFWDDAQRVGQDSVDRWYPNTDAYDLPNSTYDTERRLRHKVLYLYSGATYSDRSPVGLLHPQADETTSPGARRIDSADLVGYRYVMGERQGWGNNNHSVDEFAGIGMHVHEIGHLLGFHHPRGEWGCSRPGLLASSCPDEAIRTNPYTSQHSSQVIITPRRDGGTRRDTVRFLAANLSGWGSMQSGAHGPGRVGNRGYTSEYRSCPNPFNPFYRMELGWNARVNITTTTLNQRIEPGPGHLYIVEGANGQQYILDFRTVEEGFGQYTGWYRFARSPGLLIWRRSTHFGRFNNALLIPADRRSIFDARRRLVQAEPTSANSSYTYVWQDRLSDPFGAVEQNGPFGPLPGRTHRPTVTEATDATHLRYALGNNIPRPSRLAFRNIRIHRGASGGDYAEVDIYHNYWAGELDRNTTWRGTVYVGGDVTVPASTTLTIARGTKVRFLANTDDIGSGRDTARSELIVEGELTVEASSAVSDGGVTFRSADDTPSNADWYGIRVVGDGEATLADAMIQDGSRCVQNEGGTLTMTNATLSNCGATVTLDSIVPYPYVGQEAIQATLTPASGLTATDAEWQWQRRRHSTDAWTAITSFSATNSTYTPTTEDVGSQLRATVRYQAEDAETNVYPYAQSAATVPVAGVPDAPVLTASGRDGRASLKIKLGADNGSPITRTETRVYSVSQGDTTWRTTKGQWHAGSIDPTWSLYPILFTSGQTVTWDKLTNGKPYRFEVRSVNGVGPSAIALTEATPGQTTRLEGALLPLTAWGGDGQVRLAWRPGASWKVGQYEVQSRVARSGHGWPGWSAVPGGGSARDTTLTGLLNGTEYEFMVRAVNTKGQPLAVSNIVLARPAGRPGEPVLTASGGDGQVALAWTAASSNGSALVRYEMQGRVANSGHGWPGWSAVPGGGSAQDTTVVGLLNGTEYEFMVRAVNGVGAGLAASATATPEGSSTLAVSFGSATYAAQEGGAGVSIAVGLSPSSSQPVRIPVVVAADADTEAGDYKVAGLNAGAVVFAADESSQSFTITANEDADSDDETVSVSFGTLPAGVVAGGTTRQATVTLRDNDGVVPNPLAVRDLASRFTGLTSGQASWNPPSNALEAKVHSYRYRLDGGTIQSTTSTSASFSSLRSGRRYSVDVWAVGSSGAGPITTTAFTTDESGVAPVLAAVGPLTCYVGEYCSFTFPTASKGTAPITYKVSPPSWAKASGRSFSGTAPSSPGTASASLNASNAYGTDSESLTIEIKKRSVIGVAPVLAAVGPLTCYVGEYCSFTFPTAVRGTAPITYKVSPPSWAKASGRSFSGTAPSSPGTFSASLNASNAYGTDSESLTINVKKRGYPPVLASVSSITCYVGEYCSFTFPAATSGTSPITYKVSPPSWAKVSGSRGFAGTAPSSPGTFSASLNASNAYGTDSESLTINVKKRGYRPVLASVSSITCYVGEYCSFTFPAATSGTSPITYKVSPPSWAKASGSRGFAGAAPSSPGTFSASLNASNAYGTDSESLTIKVKRRLAMAPRRSTEFGHVLVGPWLAERPKPIWDNMDRARYGWRYRLLLATN